MSLTPSELRAVQLRSLRMYRFLEDFCQRNDLCLYVCGGGLIGALREGGFLAWDDDIDVFLPRRDYERLWTLWNEQPPQDYRLLRPTATLFTGEQMTKLFDLGARCTREEPAPELPSCLCLDIMPLDGWPRGRAARFSQLLWANLFALFAVRRPPQNHGPLVRGAAALVLGLVPAGRRGALCHYAEQRMSRFSPEECDAFTELCSGWKYIKKKYPKAVFAAPGKAPFEAGMILTPTDADTYLTIAFGDYRIPPPPAQRVPMHGLAAIDFLEKGGLPDGESGDQRDHSGL